MGIEQGAAAKAETSGQIDYAMRGLETLLNMGLDQDQALAVATMTITCPDPRAGANAHGNVAEFLGHPDHSKVVHGIMATVAEARSSNVSPELAVRMSIGGFLERGADGQPVRSNETGLKKNLSPSLLEKFLAD